MDKPVVVAMTGASGALYGVRLLDVLLQAGRDVHLTISPAATQVFERELGMQCSLNRLDIPSLLLVGRTLLGLPKRAEEPAGKATFHHHQDFSAGIASGSFQTAGMVICPCSMGSLASLAHGISGNLIQRAADVHLKERRKLIVVPRETPLGSIQLGNMKTLSDAGAVILPAMPGFYHQPKTIVDLIDFVVVRICDHLGIDTGLMERWGSDPRKEPENAI